MKRTCKQEVLQDEASLAVPPIFLFCSRYLYTRRYFQHAHFIPMVGVGKKGAY